MKRINKRDFRLVGLLALAMLVPCLSAAPILVVSYTSPNGGTGFFTYLDDTYTGLGGNPINPYETLWGGTGQLTDHEMSDQSWFSTPGPWVGWLQISADNGGALCNFPTDPGCHPALGGPPTIRFIFDGLFTFSLVQLHLDDANGFGGVDPPLTVTFFDGSQTRCFTIIDNGVGPTMFDFDLGAGPGQSCFGDPNGLADPNMPAMMGNFLDVTLDYRNFWVFLDEAMFFGDPVVVPEPATGVLAGLAGTVLFAMRKRLRRG